jgi:hypothetical protein
MPVFNPMIFAVATLAAEAEGSKSKQALPIALLASTFRSQGMALAMALMLGKLEAPKSKNATTDSASASPVSSGLTINSITPAVSKPGHQVVIKGSGFTPGSTTLQFGKATAPTEFIVADANTIYADVPKDSTAFPPGSFTQVTVTVAVGSGPTPPSATMNFVVAPYGGKASGSD